MKQVSINNHPFIPRRLCKVWHLVILHCLSGCYTVFGTAFCPFTGWVMINISFGIHNHG